MATVTEHQCSIEEYHADHSAVSHSMLEVFRRNVADYHGRFVAHTIPQPEPSAAMEFGSMVHLFILEPELFCERHCVLPPAPSGKWDKRTSEYKQAVKLYAEEGKELIEAETYTRLWLIRKAIEQHPKAKVLFELSPQREQTVRWTDEATGLACKCRCDALGEFIPDLKTCADISPEGFKYAVKKYGYARQSAWYQTGVEKATGQRLPHIFVCVTTEPPYECALYPIGPRTTWLGEEQNRIDLANMAARMQSGDWVNDYAKGLNAIELDPWEFNKHAMESGQ